MVQASKGFCNDFFIGLGGPAAVVAAELQPTHDLVEAARADVMRLAKRFAIDTAGDQGELDQALEKAEEQSERLRRVFDAVSALANDERRSEVSADLGRLIRRAMELAPKATEQSQSFKSLIESIEGSTSAPA